MPVGMGFPQSVATATIACQAIRFVLDRDPASTAVAAKGWVGHMQRFRTSVVSWLRSLTRSRLVVVGAVIGVSVALSPLAATPASAAISTSQGLNFSASEGLAVTAVTATFTATDAGPFADNINWGDGTTSAGAIFSVGGNTFTVSDTHTYAEDGNYTVTTEIIDLADNTSATTSSTAAVSEDDLSGSTKNLSLTEGSAFSGVIGGFDDGSSPDPGSDFTVTINWGDGTTSAGTVSGSAGIYTMSGAHTYGDEGSFAITAAVAEPNVPGSSVLLGEGTATVAEADALTGAGTTISAVQGQSFSGTVGTFTDSNTAAAVGDFAATIDWGDGTTTAGTVSGSAGSFTVGGTHTYASAGSFTVTTVLADDAPGTATATATTTANVRIPIADLALGLGASPNPVKQRQLLTYTITVQNSGPDPATSVLVSDTLPSTVQVAAAVTQAGESGSCTAPPLGSTGTVQCSLGSFPSGGTAWTITIVMRVVSAAKKSSISDTATVTSSTFDPTTADNTGTVATLVR
jgi:uncharacterized repeat protein (TIGR01451 family)